MLEISENVPLAPLTTLCVGGPARFFAVARTEGDAVEAVAHSAASQTGIFVLGGGSNLLISDAGFDGMVLKNEIRGVDIEGRTVRAGAGENWDELVALAVDRGLAGVECMSGIPGTVGGTPVQNVGAYGQEVADTIAEVRCIDRTTGGVAVMSAEECGFSYRSSIFNTTDRDRYIVTSVTFQLSENQAPRISYKDLQQEFAGRTPTLTEVREAVLRIRRRKSMVIDPSDPNSRSAGSFFKNPVVEGQPLDELRERFPGIPYFAFEDKFKVPAAWLIENAGFSKGFALGRAGISANHTLAIVNRGGATASEICALARLIRERVADIFGIRLIPEPQFLGFGDHEIAGGI